jgi:hypothetical protein
MYVRIAMLYLEAEDEISAEAFVGRSHAIIGKPDFNNLEVCDMNVSCGHG